MQISKRDFIGKTVMSKEGLIIGRIIKLSMERNNEEIDTTLIKPSETIDLNLFKLNNRGEIMLPVKALTKVRDVLICEELNQLVNNFKKVS